MSLENTPLVYVIVLSWNGRADTLECIRSVKESDYSNFKILLVDNRSSDDTVAAVRKEFPNTEVLQNPDNLGYAEGNNIGIRYAIERGAEFLFVLNNDTVIDRFTITALLSAAPQGTAICCPFLYNYSSTAQVDFQGYSETKFNGFNWKSAALKFDRRKVRDASASQREADLIPTAFAPGCALFFSKEVVKTVGLFDPRFFLYWEDTDFCFRARRQGYRCFVVPAASVWHKVSHSFGNETLRAIYQYYFYRNRFLWIEKNLSGFQRWRAIWRSLRLLVRPLLPLPWPDVRNPRWTVFRARLEALWDYSTRRFGPYERNGCESTTNSKLIGGSR